MRLETHIGKNEKEKVKKWAKKIKEKIIYCSISLDGYVIKIIIKENENLVPATILEIVRSIINDRTVLWVE